MLEDVGRLIDSGQWLLPLGAKKSADTLGFSETEAIDIVCTLERKDFYKSTTENYNNKIWQDVYKKKVDDLRLYIKLKISVIDDQELVVTSFKLDDNY